MAANNYYGFTHAGTHYGGISAVGSSGLDGSGVSSGYSGSYASSQSPYTGMQSSYGSGGATRQSTYQDLYGTYGSRSQGVSPADNYYHTDPLNYLTQSSSGELRSTGRYQPAAVSPSDDRGYSSVGSSSLPYTGSERASTSTYSGLRSTGHGSSTSAASARGSSSGTAAFSSDLTPRGSSITAVSSSTSKWQRPFQFGAHRARAPPKPSQLHYCEICRISCAGAQTYMEHLEGKNHKKKEAMSKSVASHGGVASISANRNNRHLYCELCDVACTCTDTFAAHINGTKHQKVLSLHQKLGKPIPDQSKMSSDDKSGKTVVTGKIPFVGGSQLKSVDGGHMEEVPLETANTLATESTDDGGAASEDIHPVGLEYIEEGCNDTGTATSFYCKLCNCHFTDPQAKYMHTKGRRHRLNYKEKVDPSLQVGIKPNPYIHRVQAEKMKKHIPVGAYWQKRQLEEVYRQEVEELRYEQELLKWQLTQASQMASAGGGSSLGASQMGGVPAGGSCFDTFGDRHISAKHTSIYPTTADLEAVQAVVSTCEKALKLVSDSLAKKKALADKPVDAVMTEIKTEPDADASAPTASESSKETTDAAAIEGVRELKGVMRVGLLAKGLLLHGDLELQLVVLCNERPTMELLMTVVSCLPDQLAAANSEEKFDVSMSPYGDGVIVQRQNEPRVTCSISLTSPAMKDEIPFDKSSEYLDRQMCLNMLAALRHTKWFQAKVGNNQTALVLIRIMRDLCQRIPTWQPLGQWAVELLVEKCLSCCNHTVSPAIGLRILFETIASGILLPGGPGLSDPCEKDPVDAIRFMSQQQREDITNSAQHALRMIAFGEIYKVLGMEPLPGMAAPPGQRKRPRADGASAGGLRPN